MPFMSSAAYAFRTGSPPEPPLVEYPTDSLIPYYGTMADLTAYYGGNDPASYGWARYSQADGFYLSPTTSNTNIGTTVGSAGGSATVLLNTASGGSHTGGTFGQWIQTTSGTVSRFTVSSAGSHSHTVGSTSAFLNSPQLMINTQDITFLRATFQQLTLPPNCLVYSQSGPLNTTSFSATNGYLRGGTTTTYTAGSTRSGTSSINTGTSGSHGHGGTTNGVAYPYYPSGYFNTYDVAFAGDHSHTMSFTATQSAISSQLYALWKCNQPAIPTNGIVVMYVGDVTKIPRPWYLCNGLNGTVNIDGAVIGYTASGWRTVTTSNFSVSSPTVSTVNASHSHNYTLRATASNITGPTAYHSSVSWSHTHTGSFSVSGATGWTPPLIKVAFIQYKG